MSKYIHSPTSPRPGARDPMQPVRQAGKTSIVVGIFLALVATWAFLAAPEDASITLVRRSSISDAGTWPLYLPAVFVIIFGLMARFNPEQLGMKNPRKWIFIILGFAAVFQVLFILEVFGYSLLSYSPNS